MKSRLLMPHGFKLLGWLLALPGFVLGYLVAYKAYEIPGFGLKLRESSSLFLPAYENFTNELALILVVAGLIFIAFSKQKIEDELTATIRLNALHWAILINYAWYGIFIILASLNTVVYIIGVRAWVDFMSNDLNFLMYNLFTPLAIFIARFYYLIYKSREEYDIKPIKLLPNKFYRRVGELITAALIVIIIIYRIFVSEDTSDTLFLMLPLAMLVWVFSKEKQEDEYINAIRLDAMQIAVYANYCILLLANFVFYGTGFLLIMVVNLATIPAIFLIVFHYRLYRIRQQDNHAARGNLNVNIL
jgi:hypothetical protein